MTGLIDLPVEILDMVCLYLRQLCSDEHETSHALGARKGLAGLCRVSRKFHPIVLPHLYHHVSISDNDTRLVPISRALLTNQHLSDLVHEIEIGLCCCIATEMIVPESFMSHSIRSGSGAMTHPTDGNTGGATGPGDYRMVKVLNALLITLRKLRSLDLSIHDYTLAQDVLTSIKDKHLHDPEFQKAFEAVTLRSSYKQVGLHFLPLLATISAMTIRKLTLWDCVGIGSSVEIHQMPSLLELRILSSTLEYFDFVSVVSCCPNLEFLRYEMRASERTDIFVQALSSSAEISRAIAPLSKTLKTMILYQDPDAVYDVEPIEKITTFGKLQDLVIGFQDLSGECFEFDEDDPAFESVWDDERSYMDNLPKSLQRLFIVEAYRSCTDEDTLRAELLRLGKTAKKRLPNLRSVIVDGSFDLKIFFAELGIDYQEVHPDSFGKSGLDLEEFSKECWQQMDKDCGDQSQRGISFNNSYTKPILPYCVRSET